MLLVKDIFELPLLHVKKIVPLKAGAFNFVIMVLFSTNLILI